MAKGGSREYNKRRSLKKGNERVQIRYCDDPLYGVTTSVSGLDR